MNDSEAWAPKEENLKSLQILKSFDHMTGKKFREIAVDLLPDLIVDASTVRFFLTFWQHLISLRVLYGRLLGYIRGA